MDLRPLIFMPALAGATIFGFVFLLFLAHYYLTVLEATASGAKQIPWTREPVTDTFWKFWYLSWLVGLWLGPAFFLGHVATVGIDSSGAKLMAPFLVLWICYPVSQLSSLSASSMWMPLVPDVFVRLAQKPKVVVEFFGLSALVLHLFAMGVQWTFLTEGDWWLLFVGSPVVVTATLLYARLLGRLAFVLRFTDGLFVTKRRKKLPIAHPTSNALEEAPKPRRAQPSELPPLATPDGDLAGYDVKFEDDPPEVPRKRLKAEIVELEAEGVPESQSRVANRRPAPDTVLERGRMWCDEDDDKVTAYGVREAEVKPGERIPANVVRSLETEMRLLKRDDRPKQPKRVWGSDLLVFLVQPGTIWALVIASGMCFVVGVMVRIARQFNPAIGGE